MHVFRTPHPTGTDGSRPDADTDRRGTHDGEAGGCRRGNIRRSDHETLYSHLLFLTAAITACIAAPLLPLQTDSAYTFFRLLQQPPLNLDDLRTLDLLTWGAMQAAVRAACSPKTLALVFALGHVAYTYLLFLIARYGFRYRQAGRLALAFACASAPLWLNWPPAR